MYINLRQNNDGFRKKQFIKLLEFIKLYGLNPLENFFYFHYLPKLYFGL